jgi:hypothetical protein
MKEGLRIVDRGTKMCGDGHLSSRSPSATVPTARVGLLHCRVQSTPSQAASKITCEIDSRRYGIYFPYTKTAITPSFIENVRLYSQPFFGHFPAKLRRARHEEDGLQVVSCFSCNGGNMDLRQPEKSSVRQETKGSIRSATHTSSIASLAACILLLTDSRTCR